MTKDTVTVTMTHCGVFEFHRDSPHFQAELLRTPQGAGDTFTLKLETGEILKLNGNSSAFVGLIMAEEKLPF